ncbi:hypothetical protein Hanom_Chr00s000003g01604421 [Helianthus anomalus]
MNSTIQKTEVSSKEFTILPHQTHTLILNFINFFKRQILLLIYFTSIIINSNYY